MPFLVKKWQRISGLLADIKTTAWVTSTEWAELAREIKGEYGSSVTPSNANFGQIKIGENLLLRNSGHDSQEDCDTANRALLGEENIRLFAFRRDNWITGKGGKPKIEPQLIVPSHD